MNFKKYLKNKSRFLLLNFKFIDYSIHIEYFYHMLEKFEEKYIPQIVERVLPLWHVDAATEDFNRLYVEMIIRTNMHENNWQFQIAEDEKLYSIAFCANKNDISNNDWLEKQYQKLNKDGKNSFDFGRKYLLMMEDKTFAYMNNDDIKLCLFVSMQKGYGSKILNEVADFFRDKGYKNIYLWTDGECNVDWYFKNGYQLINEEVYEPFSSEDYKYMTYIFKKPL